MKITYPECQIEISVDEVIDLLDYFEDRQPKVECRQDIGHLNMKLPELHIPEISEETKKEIEELIEKHMAERIESKSPYKTICCPECAHKFKEEVPDFMDGEFVTECPNCGTKIMGLRTRNTIDILTIPSKEKEDPQPEPKPYPQSGETVIPNTAEVETFLSSAIRRFFESQEKRLMMEDKLTEQSRQRIVDYENTLEEVINGDDIDSTKAVLAGLDEAWLHAENEIPNEPAPAESTKERNHDSTKKKKASTKPKKVDILFENGWKTFNSISQAAKAIDARLNHLSHALLNGKTCNGHQVRYATDNNEPTQPANEEQTELP